MLKSKVKQVPPLEIDGGTYLAKKRVNVRGGPSTDYVIVGKLAEQEAVKAIGLVKGKSWYMISQGGAGSGFVYQPLLDAAPTMTVAPTKPANNSDIEEAQVAETTVCRVIERSVNLADGTSEQEKLTACQGPNGWEIQSAPA